MSVRLRVCLVVAWVACSAVIGVWASAQVVPKPVPPEPGVISGADIGFRVEGTERGLPVGRLVIRIDGKWVEPQVSSRGRVVPVIK